MAGFFARRKFRNDVMARLNAMLLFYPGGVKNIPQDYPGITNAINGNCDAGDIPAAYSAVIIAGSILANKFENLEPDDREALRQQLCRLTLPTSRKCCAARANCRLIWRAVLPLLHSLSSWRRRTSTKAKSRSANSRTSCRRFGERSKERTQSCALRTGCGPSGRPFDLPCYSEPGSPERSRG